MKIEFFCPRWGQANIPWESFAAKVKAAGYDGVEADVPPHQADIDKMMNALAKHGLTLIAQHWETVDPVYTTHATAYAKRLAHMSKVKPLFINSQTGRDFFSTAQNARLLFMATSCTRETGIPVYHETHRGKFSFAAHITREFLQKVPALELTLDISHWFAVAESWLDDQPEAVQQAITHTRHIHARIGHTQGPQIPDPRIPEAAGALARHLAVWDKVVETNRQAGKPILTFTTEFGPEPYMTQVPNTGKPIADQWELNIFMLETLKKRYSKYPLN